MNIFENTRSQFSPMYNIVEDNESSVDYVDDDPDNYDHKVRYLVTYV
jgi:hypothetical protein